MPGRRVELKIVSRIDDEEEIRYAQGEYALKEEEHVVVYTDYSGNHVTKTGLLFHETKVLLHRVGAVTADMLFEPDQITSCSYDAFGLKTQLNIHTLKYECISTEKEKILKLHYLLHNAAGEEFNECDLEIRIRSQKERSEM